MTKEPEEQVMPESATIDDQDFYEDDWETNEHEQLPPRPRRKLIAPLPLALLAVLIAAAGFIGGVLVQKGQQDSTATGAAAGLPDFAGGPPGAGGAGQGAGGGAANATVGEVSSVKGKTIYVTDGQGNTVAVKANSASEVTRTADSDVRNVKPGDTVIVQGAKRDDGSVRASSITATAAGVQSAFPQLGAGTGAAGDQAGGDVESLFQP